MCFNRMQGDSDAHELEPTLWEVLFQWNRLVDDPICQPCQLPLWASLMARLVKNLPAMRET